MTPRSIQLSPGAVGQIEKGKRSFDIGQCLTYPDTCIPGELVQILDPDEHCIAQGYFNPQSKIPLRILSFTDKAITDAFWWDRIVSAHRYRQRFYSDDNSYRLIYGEADELPGLVVDRFENHLSVQITTAGMEHFTDTIVSILKEHFHPDSITLVNDSLPRKKEGLPLYRKVVHGNLTGPFKAKVDGLTHWIDTLHGHKTGFFLDHRENREKAARLCTGKRVLDIFSYSCAFGIRAAHHGALRVDCIDIVESALDLGRMTFQEHGLFTIADLRNTEAFQFLADPMHFRNWDLIFLDPPSFVKGNRRARRNMSNYRKINTLAINCLAPDGILVTSNCSFHVSQDEFRELVGSAMMESHRSGRIFYSGQAGPDHPIRPGMDGADYLKCLFIQMDN